MVRDGRYCVFVYITYCIAGVNVNVVFQMLQYAFQIAGACGTQEGSIAIALQDKKLISYYCSIIYYILRSCLGVELIIISYPINLWTPWDTIDKKSIIYITFN